MAAEPKVNPQVGISIWVPGVVRCGIGAVVGDFYAKNQRVAIWVPAGIFVVWQLIPIISRRVFGGSVSRSGDAYLSVTSGLVVRLILAQESIVWQFAHKVQSVAASEVEFVNLEVEVSFRLRWSAPLFCAFAPSPCCCVVVDPGSGFLVRD
ncbi:unnamed protein product [Vicia faba]|uniref:Uncharacterized protein n=1 Tax=Vicia faba TaxID=3906 RepID=A0AAV0YJF6_VICFA|nr:unnamed protein product [Vicia faba]